jgi:hypothetical protein
VTPGLVAAHARRDASADSLLTIPCADARKLASLARDRAMRMANIAPSAGMSGAAMV